MYRIDRSIHCLFLYITRFRRLRPLIYIVFLYSLLKKTIKSPPDSVIQVIRGDFIAWYDDHSFYKP